MTADLVYYQPQLFGGEHVRLSDRVAFVCRGKRTVANFPSVLVYWGPRVADFARVFGPLGEVIRGLPMVGEP